MFKGPPEAWEIKSLLYSHKVLNALFYNLEEIPLLLEKEHRPFIERAFYSAVYFIKRNARLYRDYVLKDLPEFKPLIDKILALRGRAFTKYMQDTLKDPQKVIQVFYLYFALRYIELKALQNFLKTEPQNEKPPEEEGGGIALEDLPEDFDFPF
ncbi:MAG: hypothetical protein QW733_02895 [Desulfurococcaceae archaeon]